MPIETGLGSAHFKIYSGGPVGEYIIIFLSLKQIALTSSYSHTDGIITLNCGITVIKPFFNIAKFMCTEDLYTRMLSPCNYFCSLLGGMIRSDFLISKQYTVLHRNLAFYDVGL